jgi:hypothetical protein
MKWQGTQLMRPSKTGGRKKDKIASFFRRSLDILFAIGYNNPSCP